MVDSFSRRSLLFLFGALLITAATTSNAADTPPRRPNVVFLLTDDHRFDALGCAGNPVIQTPRIDALARDGVRFRNAFVTTSICCTSRASIFTGQYARRHGINDFATPFTPAQFAQTYPLLLRQAGYRTGFVGKFGVGDKGESPAKHFDYYKGFPGQGTYFPTKGSAAKRAADGSPMHLTDVMTEQALEFLQTCTPDQPFCLSVSYKAPHAQDPDPKQYLYAPRFKDLYANATIPLPPTANEQDFARQPEFLRNSEARRRWQLRFATPASYQEMIKSYYRLITQVDESVGAIVDALQKAGVADNTVVIVTGDNGYYFGEHGLADKWFPHEESIRVPLVIRDPRLPADRRGVTDDRMALNIDLAPTLLAMAGVAVPPATQGRDLTPLLRGQSPPWRDEFFYEHLFRHKAIPMSEGVRTGRYVYWNYLNVDKDAQWLFDLQTDPHQTRNLAADPAFEKIASELRSKTVSYGEVLK